MPFFNDNEMKNGVLDVKFDAKQFNSEHLWAPGYESCGDGVRLTLSRRLPRHRPLARAIASASARSIHAS
jgi:hypothetical protein